MRCGLKLHLTVLQKQLEMVHIPKIKKLVKLLELTGQSETYT